MFGAPRKTVRVTVDVSQFWYRAAQRRAFAWPVGALTGVAITFSPMGLYALGRGGAEAMDWRVVGCAVVTYVVGLFYVSLGGPVFTHAWNSKSVSGKEAAEQDTQGH